MEPLPSLLNTYKLSMPSKCIHRTGDVDIFSRSLACHRLMTFIMLLNESVIGKKISDDCKLSQQSQRILDMLDTMDGWLDKFPAYLNDQRYGNKAFRDWHRHLKEHSADLQRTALPELMHSAIPELSVYLEGGFGNETRIDYGSGHELSFIAWLCGIAMLGGFEPDDYQAIVLRIVVRYLELVRKIQRTYMFEPAGSHGVWGLDDHQFLPYLWGSGQLINQPHILPSAIQTKQTVDDNAKEYMYFRCIQHIHEVKRGPLHEHSPMLYDISTVKTWNKVNTGMVKMFVAEVLGKFPVIQHFLCGFLFSFDKAPHTAPLSHTTPRQSA